mgnify:CR=1 FL=1
MNRCLRNLLWITLLFLPILATAATWTVDPDPTAGADFADLQQAIDAANPGDTLHMAGASEPYSYININKPLSLYGPGYFLLENEAAAGSNALPARISNLSISKGADGTLISGFVIEQNFATDPVDSDSISSVYIRGNQIMGEFECFGIKHAVVAGNYFPGPIVRFLDCPTVRFSNNIVVSDFEFDAYPDSTSNLEFHHNLFRGHFSVNDAAIDIEYSIFYDTGFDLSGINPVTN